MTIMPRMVSYEDGEDVVRCMDSDHEGGSRERYRRTLQKELQKRARDYRHVPLSEPWQEFVMPVKKVKALKSVEERLRAVLEYVPLRQFPPVQRQKGKNTISEEG